MASEVTAVLLELRRNGRMVGKAASEVTMAVVAASGRRDQRGSYVGAFCQSMVTARIKSIAGQSKVHDLT